MLCSMASVSSSRFAPVDPVLDSKQGLVTNGGLPGKPLLLPQSRQCKPNMSSSATLQTAPHAKLGLEEMLEHLERDDSHVGAETYAQVLLACSSARYLSEGKRVHALIVKNHLEQDTFTGNNLIRMYAKAGSLSDGRKIFDKMQHRNVVSWTMMIGACIDHRQCHEALQLFHKMKLELVHPNEVTFVTVLKACSSPAALAYGRLIHAEIAEAGVVSNLFVGTALINMYRKCESVQDARNVFDIMPQRNLITWAAMIQAYTDSGCLKQAMELFHRMPRDRTCRSTFVNMLSACTSPNALAEGRMVHARIEEGGLEADQVVGTALLNMYGRCGSLEDAKKAFCKVGDANVVTWTSMISVYAEYGLFKEAIGLFQRMQLEAVMPNRITFVTVLNACCSALALDEGKMIHACAEESGLDKELVVGNVIVNMYGKCGDLDNARRMFDRKQERNVISWSSMLAAYAQHGHFEDALLLYRRMQLEGILLDIIIFSIMLTACVSLSEGRQIHAGIIESGYESDAAIDVVKMYGQCGSLDDARRTFDRVHGLDRVLWTAMISVYVEHDKSKEAFQLFRKMNLEGARPDEFTLSSILSACESLKDGKLIHACVEENGYELDLVLSTALVKMYSECGSLDDACKVFVRMQHKTLVSFTAMVTACAVHGKFTEAIQLLHQMLLLGVRPDEFMLATVLSACCNLAALSKGTFVHGLVVEKGFESDVVVASTIVNMYGKCGRLQHARKMFERLRRCDAFLWNAMISAYAQHGHHDEVVQLFLEMQQEGLNPDSVSFVSVLSGCSGAGLVNEGFELFVLMRRDYGIRPEAEHYRCMIDLLARAGRVAEAEEFISRIPFKPDALTWTALMSSCGIHGDTEQAKSAAKRVLEIDPDHAPAYVTLSNIYAGMETRKLGPSDSLAGQPSDELLARRPDGRMLFPCGMPHGQPSSTRRPAVG